MEAAGDLVCVVIEFAARMHLGEDDLNRGAAVDGGVLMLHWVKGHASTVIADSAGSIDAKLHHNLGSKSRHHLVDCVVYTFIDKVVEGVKACATDVHTGALTDSLKAFKNLNRLTGVVAGVLTLLGGFVWHDGFELLAHLVMNSSPSANVDRTHHSMRNGSLEGRFGRFQEPLMEGFLSLVSQDNLSPLRGSVLIASGDLGAYTGAPYGCGSILKNRGIERASRRRTQRKEAVVCANLMGNPNNTPYDLIVGRR